MGDQLQSWVQQQKENMMLRAGKGSELPRELIDYSDTNRLLWSEQARLLITMRMATSRICSDVGMIICEMVEKHQLNVDGYSRNQMIEAIKALSGSGNQPVNKPPVL